jgi:hypothetical protein
VVNALHQVVRMISREVATGSGIRYQRDYFYDANNNLSRVDIENRMNTGTLQANSHFTTTYEYEILNHLVREVREIDSARSVINEFEYDAKRNWCARDSARRSRAGMPTTWSSSFTTSGTASYREVLAPGSPDQSTREYHYDRNGNLVRRL